MKKSFFRISNELMKEWFGPSGLFWCEKENKFIEPEDNKEAPECEAIEVVDHRPSRYLRPTDMVW